MSAHLLMLGKNERLSGHVILHHVSQLKFKYITMLLRKTPQTARTQFLEFAHIPSNIHLPLAATAFKGDHASLSVDLTPLE
jgi:hypothetical protein